LTGNLGAEGALAVLSRLQELLRLREPTGVEPLLESLQHELELVFEAARVLALEDRSEQGGEAAVSRQELMPLFRKLAGLLGCNNLQAVQLFAEMAPHLAPSLEL